MDYRNYLSYFIQIKSYLPFNDLNDRIKEFIKQGYKSGRIKRCFIKCVEEIDYSLGYVIVIGGSKGEWLEEFGYKTMVKDIEPTFGEKLIDMIIADNNDVIIYK